MSTNVGSIHYDLKLDTSKFDTASQRVGQSLDTMKTQLVKLTAIAGTASSALAIFGVKTAGDLEASRQGFITLLGSAEKADEVLNQIKQDAKKTPFELKGLIQANQMLTAVTKDGKKSEKILLNVGKALSAMGRGQEELDRIIVNLQQIGAVGHASMIDIKQFAFAGIPIFDMLTEATGKTGQALDDMISNGDISFEMLTDMFNKAGSAGGRFEKAFENQAGTFNQLVSNMKDSFTIFASDFVKQTGIFDFSKRAIERLTGAMVNNKDSLVGSFKQIVQNIKDVADKISTYLGPKLEALWSTITTKLYPAVSNLIKSLGPEAGVGLVAILGLAIDAFNFLLQALTPVINFISNNTWIVWSLVTAFLALKTALFIGNAVNAFVTGLATIRGAMILTDATAIASTGKITALRTAMALLANPWVMSLSIVGVSAVIASLYGVKEAIQSIIDKWREMDKNRSVSINNGQVQVKANSDVGLAQRFINAFRSGFAYGGFTGRGRVNEVAGVVHKGEYVLPQSMVDQSSGMPKNMASNVNFYGNISIGDQQTADYFFARLTRNQELASKNIATRSGAIG